MSGAQADWGTYADITIAIAAITGLLFYWLQARHARSSLDAQMMIKLHDLADQYNYSEGLKLLKELNECQNGGSVGKSPQELYRSWNDDTKKVFRSYVSFLNFAAILYEAGVVDKKKLWNMYFWDYDMCYNVLISRESGCAVQEPDNSRVGWWIQMERKNDHETRFSNFKRMCYLVAWQCDFERYEQKRKRNWRSRLIQNSLEQEHCDLYQNRCNYYLAGCKDSSLTKKIYYNMRCRLCRNLGALKYMSFIGWLRSWYVEYPYSKLVG